MIEERRLTKTEASLGLTLIGGLLIALGCAYVYQLDSPPPVTPPDPNWVSAQPAPAATAIEQTAYRPEWLNAESETAEAKFVR
jgi:hypothetical protein